MFQHWHITATSRTSLRINASSTFLPSRKDEFIQWHFQETNFPWKKIYLYIFPHSHQMPRSFQEHSSSDIFFSFQMFFIFFLSIFGIPNSHAIKITACNCLQPQLVGAIKMSDLTDCENEIVLAPPQSVDYVILSNKRENEHFRFYDVKGRFLRYGTLRLVF